MEIAMTIEQKIASALSNDATTSADLCAKGHHPIHGAAPFSEFCRPEHRHGALQVKALLALNR
jgi:hypothetical protein